MPRRDGLSRRRFLAGSAAAGLGLALPGFAEERPMPMRELGRTGVKVSLAGLGTAQFNRGLGQERASEIVHRALDLGINYIDTAFSYGNGHAERFLGNALRGRRDDVFLTTKTIPRDRKSAQSELETSLKRLQTDHVDLWQFHALSDPAQTKRILERSGAMEAALAAKKAGKVRFLGITGHEDPSVFIDAIQTYDFDTVLVPLNCIDPHHLSFETRFLQKAVKKKMGIIAMKVYCSGRLPSKNIVGAEDCLRYTYGLPISTCIVGCRSRAEVEQAAHVARNLRAMDEKERASLRAKTKPHSPGLEWYKAK